MSIGGITQAVNGFESGLYSELEFFNLVAIRTSSNEVADAYDAIPKIYKAKFLHWIDGYVTRSDSICIGEGVPKLDVIEAFRQFKINLKSGAIE